MKGVTPVIATILLLLVTISIIGIAFVFMQRIAADTTNAGQQQVQNQLKSSGECLRIEAVSGSVVYVRNCGTVDIDPGQLTVLIDDTPYALTGSVIGQGTIGTASLSSAPSPGNHVMKIASQRATDVITYTATSSGPINNAPVITNLLSNQTFVGQFSIITVTGTAADSDGDQIYLLCTESPPAGPWDRCKAGTNLPVLSNPSCQLDPWVDEGLKTVTCKVSDGSLESSNDDVQITSDLTAPGYTQKHPTTSYRYNSPPVLQYTATDLNLKECYYRDDIDYVIIPGCNNLSSVGIDGLNSLNVLAYDQAGNVQGRTTAFNVVSELTADANTIGLWNFNEGAGTTASDSSGNNNHLTLQMTNWSGGVTGGSILFHKPGDNVSAPDTDNSLDLGPGGQITIQAWVNPIIVPGAVVIIHKGKMSSSISNYGLWLVNSSGNIEARFSMDSTHNTDTIGANIPMNTWSFITASFNDATNTVKIWVDGINYATNSGEVYVPVPNNENLEIGSTDVSSYQFKGSMDQIRIKNFAIAGPSGNADYITTYPVELDAAAGTMGLWHFNEADGTVAYDSSGNNNALSLTSNKWRIGIVGSAFNMTGCVSPPPSCNTNVYGTAQLSSSLYAPDAVTTEFWIYRTQEMSENLVQYKDGTYTNYRVEIGSLLTLKFLSQEAVTFGYIVATSSVTPPIEQWVFVAVTFDRSTGMAKFYIDGVLAESVPVSVVPPFSLSNPLPQPIDPVNTKLTIGGAGSLLRAKIDEVRISNRALTDDEIYNDYLATRPAI